MHYAQAFRDRPAKNPAVEVTPVDISQLPAFLLRPVKLPKAPEKKVVEKKPVEAKAPEVKAPEPEAPEAQAEEPKKAVAKKPRAPRKKKVVKVEAPAEPDAV